MKQKIQILCTAILFFFSIFNLAFAGTPSINSAKITGPNTVTIVFSEAVNTKAGDYSNFSGYIGGHNISSISGNNTNTITLNFTGTNFTTDATGGFNIASSTVSSVDNSVFNSSYVNVTDGQAPLISSLTAGVSPNAPSTNLAKTGDIINLTFTANEVLKNPVVTISGKSASVTGSGNGPYTASYTLVSGDTQSAVPFVVNITDLAGNSAAPIRGSLFLNSSTAPTIASITSTANSTGILTLGNTITFTLTPTTADPNLKVSGYYNGSLLNWSTNNNGATYTAVYTVNTSNPSQGTPLQISGVTITDANGNTSPSFTGSDILKTISVSSPTLTEVIPVPINSTTPSPSYTFNSTVAGTIVYNGDCSSQTTSAIAGINTIYFNPLTPGTHNNCSLVVKDSLGNQSNTLYILSFNVNPGSQTSLPMNPSPESTPQANSGYKFTKFLKLGNIDPEVTELQKKLVELGFLKATPTGKFGAQTQTALKAFQRANNLKPAGYVGPGTRDALNK